MDNLHYRQPHAATLCTDYFTSAVKTFLQSFTISSFYLDLQIASFITLWVCTRHAEMCCCWGVTYIDLFSKPSSRRNRPLGTNWLAFCSADWQVAPRLSPYCTCLAVNKYNYSYPFVQSMFNQLVVKTILEWFAVLWTWTLFLTYFGSSPSNDWRTRTEAVNVLFLLLGNDRDS